MVPDPTVACSLGLATASVAAGDTIGAGPDTASPSSIEETGSEFLLGLVLTVAAPCLVNLMGLDGQLWPSPGQGLLLDKP